MEAFNTLKAGAEVVVVCYSSMYGSRNIRTVSKVAANYIEVSGERYSRKTGRSTQGYSKMLSLDVESAQAEKRLTYLLHRAQEAVDVNGLHSFMGLRVGFNHTAEQGLALLAKVRASLDRAEATLKGEV